MKPDLHPDWSNWSKAWQDSPRPSPELRSELVERVRREGRWLRVRAWLEGLFAVAVLAGSAILAARDASWPTIVWAVAVWCFTILAWTRSLWTRRGLWELDGPGVDGFLEISRARLIYSLRAASFGQWLLVAELVFVIGWCIWRRWLEPADFARDFDRYLLVWTLTAVFSAGVVAWIVLTRRRATRELEALDEMRRGLEDT
jgi:hypothetical protein